MQIWRTKEISGCGVREGSELTSVTSYSCLLRAGKMYLDPQPDSQKLSWNVGNVSSMLSIRS